MIQTIFAFRVSLKGLTGVVFTKEKWMARKPMLDYARKRGLPRKSMDVVEVERAEDLEHCRLFGSIQPELDELYSEELFQPYYPKP